MTDVPDLPEQDRRLTRRIALWDSAFARRVLPAVESAAEHTKLWWGIGRDGRGRRVPGPKSGSSGACEHGGTRADLQRGVQAAV
jgi:hypothetical protein